MDTPIPAATLVLLREAAAGPPEMLMVRRDKAMAFAAGAWVWPGGRVDEGDLQKAEDDVLEAAKLAAIREAREEVAMPALPPEKLAPFARWLPKFHVSRRFDTWFFLARAPQAWELQLQEGEIIDARWTTAASMLAQIADGTAGAIFPTMRNLERLAQFDAIDEAFADAAAHPTDPITPWVETRSGIDHVVIAEGIGYPITAEPLTTATRA